LSLKLCHREEANRPKNAIDFFRISSHPYESEDMRELCSLFQNEGDVKFLTICADVSPLPAWVVGAFEIFLT
jgi:hypothetical protein